jgi:trans-aconitate methyltransferase
MNFWEERYQKAQTGWERGHINHAFGDWNAFADLEVGRVLVPGCGRAPEVDAFASLGWQVVAVDMAPSAVAFQKEQLQQYADRVEVIEADLLTWQCDEPFDLIYEQTCLCALNPEHWLQYEQQLSVWLKPGGQLAALFMQTNKEGGPPFHCEWSVMQDLFKTDRWQWPNTEPLHSVHPSGIHELGVRLTRIKST